MESCWYLERLGFTEDPIKLEKGETNIGRGKNAQITIDSLFCSRVHCTIYIDGNNKIKLKDKMTINGTYVNFVLYKGKEVILKKNDRIAVGCTGESINDSKFYVYKLRKENGDDSDTSVKTELLDEEENIQIISDDDECNYNNNNSNSNENNNDNNDNNVAIELNSSNDDLSGSENRLPIVEKTNDFAPAIVQPSEISKTDSILFNEGENSNDFHFSQQVLMEFKTDAIMDENPYILTDNSNIPDDVKLLNNNNKKRNDFDNDIIDLLSDEEEADEEESKVNIWLKKLSQNVDFQNIKYEPVEEIFKDEIPEVRENHQHVFDVEEEDYELQNCFVSLKLLKYNQIANEDNNKDLSPDLSPLKIIKKRKKHHNLFSSSSSSSGDDYPSKKIKKTAFNTNSIIKKTKSDSKTVLSKEFLDENKTKSIVKPTESLVKKTTESDTHIPGLPIVETINENRIQTEKKNQEFTYESSGDDYFGNNESNKNTIVHTKQYQKSIKLIEPVHMPEKKRRISTVVKELPTTVTNINKESKHKSTVCRGKLTKEYDIEKQRKRVLREEKIRLERIDLKKKWRQKPPQKSIYTSANLNDIKENRKIKLKEIANAKKKNDLNDDDPKTLFTPKVKLTIQNRGAFLTETITNESTSKNTICQTSKNTKNSIDIGVNNKVKTSSTKNILPKIPKFSKTSNEKIETRKSDIDLSDELLNISPLIDLKIASNLAPIKPPLPDLPKSLDRPTPPPPLPALPILQLADVISHALPFPFPTDNNISSKASIPNKMSFKTLNSTKVLKSIMKTSSNSDKKKTVSFKTQPHEVRFFQLEEGNNLRKILTGKDALPPRKLTQFVKRKLRNKDPNEHPGQNVLTDILGWNPNWLNEYSGKDPPVNGENHILLPTIHSFNSINDYQRIFLPLQKLEIWSQIYIDFNSGLKITYDCILQQCNSAPRGNGFRNIYTCLVTFDKCERQIGAGTLILIQYTHLNYSQKFFGYITDSRFIKLSNNKILNLTFESAQNKNLSMSFLPNLNFKLTVISYVRVDISSLNAIFDLSESPLCNYILNPTLYPPSEFIINKYHYKGADHLNIDQGNILMHIYHESLNRLKPSTILVNGPPGTGKSCLIANLALQLLYGDEIKHTPFKILICSGSNQAIDIITNKLLYARQKRLGKKFKLLRFGLLEKMHTYVQNVSLQKLVLKNQEHEQSMQLNVATNSENVINLRLMKDEKLFLEEKLKFLKTKNNNNNNKNNLQKDEIISYQEKLNRVNQILNDKNNIFNQENERKTSVKLMEHAEVVCTTLSSCINMMSNYDLAYDICIIDEATQCTELMCLIPIQFQISTLVLVGDTQQLPASVLSRTAKENGLANSLFTRILKNFDGTAHTPLKSLTTQYRMHPEICSFPNKYFYNNLLMTESSTIDQYFPFHPYIVLNHNYFQDYTTDMANISNCKEAEFIVNLLTEITKHVSCIQFTYGIATPYNSQKKIIQNLIMNSESTALKNINVNTIDSYQGQESDIIILSTTRTDGVGFLGHSQRLNVALTRAKRCLIVCGNFISLRNQTIWSSLLEDAEQRKVLKIISSTSTFVDENIVNMIRKQ